VEHRKRVLRHVGIAVLMLLCIAVGLMICVAGLHFDSKTPGIYVAGWLFAGSSGVIGVVTIPVLLVVGFVNGVCCYALIRGPVAIISRFRTRQFGKPAS
jgi:hypothetical protein